MPQSQSRWSLNDVLIPVDLVIPEGANPEPQDDPVYFQFVNGGLPPRAQPTEDGWTAGFWLQLQSGQLIAGINVGPGGAVTLEPGRYAIWIKVEDSPTLPVAAVDTLTIT